MAAVWGAARRESMTLQVMDEAMPFQVMCDCMTFQVLRDWMSFQVMCDWMTFQVMCKALHAPPHWPMLGGPRQAPRVGTRPVAGQGITAGGSSRCPQSR